MLLRIYKKIYKGVYESSKTIVKKPLYGSGNDTHAKNMIYWASNTVRKRKTQAKT